MKTPIYKRYESDYINPRKRRLSQIVANEIVVTFGGKPADIKALVKVINKDSLYERNISEADIKSLVGSWGNNLFWVGDKVCTVSSRMPENLKDF